jgi:hypothetical protein
MNSITPVDGMIMRMIVIGGDLKLHVDQDGCLVSYILEG